MLFKLIPTIMFLVISLALINLLGHLQVDHSVVETFAQGGRTVVTSRVYPQDAQGKNAHVFLFNNGSEPITEDTVEVRKYKHSEICRL